MYKSIYVLLVIFCCIFCLHSVSAYNPETFPDVSEEYRNDVHLLKELNIISGLEDGTFRGDLPVTRAEFATLVYNVLIDEPYRWEEIDTTYFVDVTTEDWFCTAITVGVNRRVVFGYGDGTFRPGNYITVKEAGIMCVNLLNLRFHANKDGYDYVIDLLDICNIGKADDEYITRYDAARIIAGVLETECMPEATDFWNTEEYFETILDLKSILKVYGTDVLYEDGKYVVSGTYRIPKSVKTDVFKCDFEENLSEFLNSKVELYLKVDGDNYKLIHIRKSDWGKEDITFVSLF